MNRARPRLITVDVGGTLGTPGGPSLASILVETSPLPAAEARRRLRGLLHTAPAITEPLIDELCRSLKLPPETYPRQWAPTPLGLFNGVREAVRALSEYSPVATFSNVTCIEDDPRQLHELLSPWVTRHFASCRLGYSKPDRRAFEAVADDFGINTAEMVHIGDNWECDIVGATSSGADAIWVANTATEPKTARQSTIRSNVLVATDLGDAAKQLGEALMRRHL